VADDKKKDGEAKAEEGKKKGLPAIILVIAGAVVGGAGVVLAVPPKVKEVPVEAPVYEVVDVTHPDAFKKTLNPRSTTGKGTARIEFKFVYSVREDREQEAFERIKANWEAANSKTLMLLKNRTMRELQSEAGIVALEKDLIEELDRSLFPGKPADKVARVERILWVDLLFQ
jgi:flagellar basal body-associated protein FliL